jgi:asparagine synthase (glutamine-hydrolysing)
MDRGFAAVVGGFGLKIVHGAVGLDPDESTCLASGEITNAAELSSELNLSAAAAAEEVVAAGYGRWGAEVLTRLRGRFALLVWDAAARKGLVGVDQLGAGSIFYATPSGDLFVATELRLLLEALKSQPAPDELAVMEWIADGALQRGRTLYAGVSRLTGGSTLTFGSDGYRREGVWRPRYSEPLRGSRRELAAALRDEVFAAVRRRRRGDGVIGTLLSGGLDSSTIAVVAAQSGPSAAYSLTFPSHDGVDESPYIEFLTERLTIPSRHVGMHEQRLLAPIPAFVQEWAWPCISPSLGPNLAVARLAAEDRVEVLFDGEGGDELFGPSPYLLADALRSGRVLTALRLARQLAGAGERPPSRLIRWLIREYGLKGAAPRAFHISARRVRGVRAYALPWLSKRTTRMLAAADESWDWKARYEGPRWWAHRVDQLIAGRERVGAHDYLRRKSAIAGVADAHPFLDDLDLVDFVLRLPPHVTLDAQLDRPLLREAMNGVLPDEIRLRPHKATFDEFIEACLDGPDRVLLQELVASPHSEVRAYVRGDVVRDLFFGASGERRPVGWAGTIWRLASIELWLRAQKAGGSEPFEAEAEAIRASS